MTKNELKYYSSLLQKKFRHTEKKFLVEGAKLIEEGLDSNFKCEVIITSKLFFENNEEFFRSVKLKHVKIEIVKAVDFDKLTDTKTSQGVIAVFYIPELKVASTLGEKVVIGLENISDPGNLGTILRNCDWFGVNEVLLSPGCAEIYNPKVIRASAGSVFHLKINEQKDFYKYLNHQKENGYKVLCADLDGINIFSYEDSGKNILVLANEANGPTNVLLNVCTSKVTIPKKGRAESLNVASASAILISELTKRY